MKPGRKVVLPEQNTAEETELFALFFRSTVEIPGISRELNSLLLILCLFLPNSVISNEKVLQYEELIFISIQVKKLFFWEKICEGF